MRKFYRNPWTCEIERTLQLQRLLAIHSTVFNLPALNALRIGPVSGALGNMPGDQQVPAAAMAEAIPYTERLLMNGTWAMMTCEYTRFIRLRSWSFHNLMMNAWQQGRSGRQTKLNLVLNLPLLTSIRLHTGREFSWTLSTECIRNAVPWKATRCLSVFIRFRVRFVEMADQSTVKPYWPQYRNQRFQFRPDYCSILFCISA